MLRRLALTIGVCLAVFAAHAQQVGIPYSVTCNGTATTVTPLTNVAASTTNWVELAAMLVTVPANSTGTVTVATHVGGTVASQSSYSVDFVNVTATASPRFVMPRKSVTSVSTPEVALYPLYGTNALLSVAKTGPSTNVWAVTLLLSQ
jgi:hypothetical protein